MSFHNSLIQVSHLAVTGYLHVSVLKSSLCSVMDIEIYVTVPSQVQIFHL